jgi:hypothetical protein
MSPVPVARWQISVAKGQDLDVTAADNCYVTTTLDSPPPPVPPERQPKKRWPSRLLLVFVAPALVLGLTASNKGTGGGVASGGHTLNNTNVHDFESLADNTQSVLENAALHRLHIAVNACTAVAMMDTWHEIEQQSWTYPTLVEATKAYSDGPIPCDHKHSDPPMQKPMPPQAAAEPSAPSSSASQSTSPYNPSSPNYVNPVGQPSSTPCPASTPPVSPAPTPPALPDPCTLVTPSDAAAAFGPGLTQSVNPSEEACTYWRSGSPDGSTPGIDFGVSDFTVPVGHLQQHPQRVGTSSFAPSPTPVAGIGDYAVLNETGLIFQKGPVEVTISQATIVSPQDEQRLRTLAAQAAGRI